MWLINITIYAPTGSHFVTDKTLQPPALGLLELGLLPLLLFLTKRYLANSLATLNLTLDLLFSIYSELVLSLLAFPLLSPSFCPPSFQ